MAVQAIKNDPDLSIRATARIYSVPHSTLATCLKGMTSRRDSMPKSRNLTDLEELTIIFIMCLTWMHDHFLHDFVMWKIWPIDCFVIATHLLLGSDGLPTS